jgi:hypothetical protein
MVGRSRAVSGMTAWLSEQTVVALVPGLRWFGLWIFGGFGNLYAPDAGCVGRLDGSSEVCLVMRLGFVLVGAAIGLLGALLVIGFGELLAKRAFALPRRPRPRRG